MERKSEKILERQCVGCGKTFMWNPHRKFCDSCKAEKNRRHVYKWRKENLAEYKEYQKQRAFKRTQKYKDCQRIMEIVDKK